MVARAHDRGERGPTLIVPLLDLEASTTARGGPDGETALDVARRKGNAACVALLDPTPRRRRRSHRPRRPPTEAEEAGGAAEAAAAADARAVEHRGEAAGCGGGEPPQAAEGAARGEDESSPTIGVVGAAVQRLYGHEVAVRMFEKAKVDPRTNDARLFVHARMGT